MNEILKQRLIGACILLALGIVFWPIVFVPPEDRELSAPRPVLEPPVVAVPWHEPDPASLPDTPDLLADDVVPVADLVPRDDRVVPLEQAGDTTGASAAPVVTTSPVPPSPPPPPPSPPPATAAETPPPPATTHSAGVQQAWTLQVATVSSQEKAETLRLRLQQLNHQAYVTPVYSGDRRLYRVSIGPKYERAELARLQTSIDAEFGVSTLIVRYTP